MAEWYKVKTKYCDNCKNKRHCHTPCPLVNSALWGLPCEKQILEMCTRIKEKDGGEPKVTCLNCKHLMFSDMYGECNKQLRIVNPSDTCEYAEPKERGN